METKNNKQGAASFYMIIVSALLFGVIAAGFITLMVSEMSKSSENNLSQTAYDSALVGVEDAKILLQKYNAILSDNFTGSDEEKAAIQNAIEEKEDSGCNKLGSTTGKVSDTGSGYSVQEQTSGSDITVQAYTCIDINLHPTDYLGTLSAENPTRLIPLQSTDNSGTKYVRISWYSSDNLGNGQTQFKNPIDTDGNVDIAFSDEASTPPVIVASVYQTENTFTPDSLTKDNAKNRGTLWLVPSDTKNNPIDNSDSRHDDYQWWPDLSSANNESRKTTQLNSYALTDSNKHDTDKEKIEDVKTSHKGYPVRCAKKEGADNETTGRDYLCSVQLELPELTNRSSERGTFLLFLAMPYGQPTTDFKVEMSNTGFKDGEFDAKEFNNVQIIIDSTGRANDVYSRVESRIEFYDSDFPFPDYALTAGNGDEKGAIWKDFITSSATNEGCWSSSWINGSPSIPENCK